ncbi:MAG: hypothetical protein A3F82_06250 [Deltaproteobacteria bacterium RIFCSPLOWO2_12_FULL_44_12]|nr:MAG: hypothetical protein A2712_01055 [Deltaproteobacteria bacterium RIFCSPHIGHO2_01_FULL_43_49]OGQ15275.1 MAG: hypothetical protein A3D22_04420 [Deltaproteobacteria bacterium RIFCSPHIGHO2_02_FULL_44_53]OGQ27101.1 MAG: hypothetical protein A3D98_01645 [Deltaproteobacteria bacterium RIFCSPHIGHO2_12_FULL_44_21]OGQ31791.1 MAG: hypothetical protein A2979_05580 [Deltaproteobacteria bacterium RIFCSPLOWO2_01_FULL_45_74]OGQ42993.1 MAG: hypothetical protein A3I70_07885 [Deltaproteobacteria bacterium 
MSNLGPGRKVFFVLVGLFCFLIFSFGCGERKPSTKSQTQQGAGGEGTPGEGLAPPAIFPHSENWASPIDHGVWTAQNGSEVCLNCHKIESAQVETPPTCHSCHKLFPHPDTWVKKENHGSFVLTNGKGSCATQCHGTDLNGGLSKLACDSCHEIYPHKQTWIVPAEHGAAAEGNGKLNCKGCHGDDFRGGLSGKSCYECHELFPHEKGWYDPQRVQQKHRDFVMANGTTSCATQCHGTDLGGGLSGRSCNECHQWLPWFPHPEGWKDYEGHGTYVLQTLGNDKTSCKLCHGNDFLGGFSGVSCSNSSCHSNYPHDPATWGQAANHGPPAYGAGKTSCATANCHGTVFQGSQYQVSPGNPLAPSCFNSGCHADFPHIDPKWMTPDKTNNAVTRDESFHGDRFIRQVQRGVVTCTGCHGINYDRVVGGYQCTACHADGITHKIIGTATWSSGLGHGKFFSNRGFLAIDTSVRCWDCHGSPVIFDKTQTRPFLENQSDCYRCHFAYPHKGYQDQDLLTWEPVNINVCGTRNSANAPAHYFYLFENPLSVDVSNTCGGGTNGSCHSNGYRAYRIEGFSGFAPCNYCHGQSNPPPPLPDCAGPPPSNLQNPGAPTITSIYPARDETSVLVGSAIRIQFSEAMETASITQTGTFVLRQVGRPDSIMANIVCSNDWCRQASLVPAAQLLRDTLYEATVTTATKDWGGTAMAADYSWTFRTELPDTTPPLIVSTIPASGAVDVPRGRYIYVTFNELVNQFFIRDSIKVKNLTTGGAIAGATGCSSAVVSNGCTTVRFQRNTTASYDTEYEVRVLTIVRDLSGNPLQSEHRWTFRTAEAPPGP